MSDDVVQKLQDKATVLTLERKKRGRTIPEDLISSDQLKNFKTMASHPVSDIYVLVFKMKLNGNTSIQLLINKHH